MVRGSETMAERMGKMLRPSVERTPKHESRQLEPQGFLGGWGPEDFGRFGFIGLEVDENPKP